MCTVSFIPVGENYFITSNRDEKTIRKPALAPQLYCVNEMGILFPKDTDAGGSWIGMNRNGDAAVLLNGAFSKHIPGKSYQRSRGLVFTEILSSCMPLKYFDELDLTGIESFTIIILEKLFLFECRWNGVKKFYKQLPVTEAYIWSSVTLYDTAISQKREAWFTEWMQSNPSPVQKDIINFHHFTGDGDIKNNLVMNRDNVLKTVSITSMDLTKESGTIVYHDLQNNLQSIQQLLFAAEEVSG